MKPRVRYPLLAVVALLLAVSFPAVGVSAGPVTPMEAIARLKAGNATFVDKPEAALAITADQRRGLAKGQSPFASVLSCADSRVPPEVVFHTGLGELFVVRAAGHVADRSVLASLEYAAEHLHVPLIVVMGHEACGAVKATIDTPPGKSLGPNLDFLIKAIRPAVNAAAGAPEATRLRAAILENVADTLNDLVDQSAILREKFEGGEIGLVGGFYELSTGRVTFSEPIAAHGTTLR